MNEDHERYREVVFGDTYHRFICHIEEKVCTLKSGGDFNYCPFCSEEL